MATEIDELVTKLSYDTASVKDIAKAEAQVEKLSGANEDAAKTTDILSKEQLALSKQLNTTAERSAKLRAQKSKLQETIKRTGKATQAQERWTKKLDKALRGVGKEERELRATGRELGEQQRRVALESRKNSREQAKLSRAIRKTNNRMREQGRASSETRQKLKEFASSAASSAKTVGVAGVAAAAAAGTAIFKTGQAILTTGVEFEALRARLKTVEGSAEGAASAFGLIQDFATTTPFQLQDVTNAYIKLKNLGLDPSQESLTAFGNIASAQGKSVIDFIEAVADASTNEFERLKEFGIKASSQGENVAFTFKGITTTVGKNADEIQGYLKGLGETEFAGAMADQMATAAGGISNFHDRVGQLFDKTAQLGPLEAFKGLLSDIAGVSDDELAPILADVLTEGIEGLREVIQNLTEEDIREFLEGVADGARGLYEMAQLLLGGLQSLNGIMGDTGDTLKVLTLLAAGLALAMMGPAGIVVGAGLVGVALGEMGASGIASLMGLNDELSKTEDRVKGLQKEIAASNKSITDAANRVDERQKKLTEQEEANAKKRAGRLGTTTGGLGKGLAQELSAEEAGFQAQFLELGDKASQESAQAKLLTAEGRQVRDAVLKAEGKKVQQSEKRARQEARSRGASAEEADKAASRARETSQDAATRNRSKAFKQAQKTFEETGSAEAAALAGARQVEGRGKKGKRKKGKKSSAAKKDEKGRISKTIREGIEARSREAGERKAARAVEDARRDGRSVSDAELDNIQKQERSAVESRLTARYNETGELPAGIRSDVRQIGRTPGVEAAGGKVAPPVISITQIKGVTINIETNVENAGATAQQIASANSDAFRSLSRRDAGDAIRMSQTSEVR